jgi:ribose transport system ATP-binding protein
VSDSGSDGVVLRMRDITKRFTGVLALSHVDLELHRGEVLVLVGENGAGKSTLMKILAGAYQKDSGDIELQGQPTEIRNPSHAKELGISIVFQEQALMPDLDAIYNIFLGREITSALGNSYLGVLNRRAMVEKAKTYFDAFASHINITVPIRELGLGQRQIIEIIRALTQNASILIMDEPTSALEDFERKQLFDFINKLRQTGVAIIYVSHHLEECLEIGDRVMVLRDGQKVGELDIKEASIDRIIQWMVGRTLTEQYPKEAVDISKSPILEARSLSHRRAFSDISFSVHRGEILGIGGLTGSGKSELARALFGAEKVVSGTIHLDGRPLPLHLSPQEAIRHGIAFLPADRKGEGLFLEHDIKYNITIANLGDVIQGWIRAAMENIVATDYVGKLSIKTPSIYQTARNLSGGNQQKVMLARWLFTQPKVLIFEEPTRGIDVNAKVEVYKLIGQFVKQGGAVILVSSELPELEGLCDRVIVMHSGSVSAELPRERLSQETIAYYSVAGEGNNARK